MTAEQFISELRGEFPKYNDMGMIEPSSIYRWLYNALKRFGGDICETREMIIDVRKGVAVLPNHYFDLIFAYKCDPYLIVSGRKIKPHLQNIFGYATQEQNEFKWCSCDQCCVEETEKHVVERIYINVDESKWEIQRYYRNPVLLRL